MAARKAGMATGVTVARINVKVMPDTKEFRRALKAELEEIERTMKGDVHIKAHLDSAQARADFERLKNAMNKDRVRIGVDLAPGKGGGGSGGGWAADDLDSQTKKGGKFLGLVNELTANIKAPSFGTGINFAGYAVILAAITALAAPLIGLITSALMTLPGIIMTALAPIAAITLGLNGISDAAKNAGLFEDKKPGKSGGGSIGAALTELRDKVNQTFREELTPAFIKIGSLFQQPAFQTGFVKIASGISKMVDGFGEAISKGQGLQSINNALANIGNGLGAMSPGIRDFTTGFAQLIEQFTAKLPDIADWFNKAGKGFMDYIKELSDSGQLSNIFDGLGQSIRVVLDMLGDMAKTGLNFMSDPTKIQGFLDVLKQVASALEGIVRLSDSIGKVWSWNPGTWVDRALRAVGLNDGYVAPGEIGIMDRLNAKSTNIPTGDMAPREAQVERLNKALENTQFKSQQAQQGLSQLLGDGATAPAKIQGPGFNNDYPIGGPVGKGEESAGPKVPPPDTSEAEAKIKQYADTTKTQMDQAKQSIEQVSTQIKPAAPDMSAFKSALDAMPGMARDVMNRVAEAVTTGALASVKAVGDAGVQMVQALAAVIPSFAQAGVEMMNGLAGGIQAGGASAIAAAGAVARQALATAKSELGIKSPSRKFMEVGDQSMKGLAIGMEGGFEPVLKQAKDLAGKIADAFSTGIDPTGNLSGFTDKETSRMGKVLGFESRRIGLQAKALEYKYKQTKDESFRAQAEALRQKQDEISMQKEMLSLTQEYAGLQGGDGESDWKGPIAKAMDSMARMPMDFMQATGKQMMQDIGISGGGALGALMDYGTQLGNSFVFNVANMEDALTAQQRLVNKQSLGVVGR